MNHERMIWMIELNFSFKKRRIATGWQVRPTRNYFRSSDAPQLFSYRFILTHFLLQHQTHTLLIYRSHLIGSKWVWIKLTRQSTHQEWSESIRLSCIVAHLEGCFSQTHGRLWTRLVLNVCEASHFPTFAQRENVLPFPSVMNMAHSYVLLPPQRHICAERLSEVHFSGIDTRNRQNRSKLSDLNHFVSCHMSKWARVHLVKQRKQFCSKQSDLAASRIDFTSSVQTIMLCFLFVSIWLN